MNRTISFCVKNHQGQISQIRTLTIKSGGACYINYDNKINDYHFSLHTPNEKNINGQMHIKEHRKIVYKQTVTNFHDFNSHRCFESVIILESELRDTEKEISQSVNILELPENHMVHIVFIRSNKSWGAIQAAFFSDKPTSQPDEKNIPYQVFCRVEDMPDANYYLTYNIMPINKAVSDLVNSAKGAYINNIQKAIVDNRIFHVRHPFLNSDIEICITNQDVLKHKNSNHE